MKPALPPAIACLPVLILLLALSGCAPSLDWREVRPQDSAVVAMFPCRPASHARDVQLAGAKVRLTLHACTAGDTTWALAFGELADPARVGPALLELRESAAANLQAAAPQVLPLKVEGATPNEHMARLALQGRLPDGRPVQEQLAVFAKGLRVYQATAVGARLPAEGLEVFFGGLKAP